VKPETIVLHEGVAMMADPREETLTR